MVDIDHEAYDYLHRRGRKRAGEFDFLPIYAANSEFAEVISQLRQTIDEHLID